ncbi:unnamed protein product [Brachionus calyciflorus]|uniref:Uncharacterized protein n=1 Tax=Brachionus calyciflorus TaxID=104777 RepID=A0A814PJX0_9BILA|nr:unnamed protein product [Brachionus calyciflorus]
MANFEYIKSNTWKGDYEPDQKEKKEKRGLQVLMNDDNQIIAEVISHSNIFTAVEALQKEKVGVAQQNISSSDEDENVSEDSSDQETDDMSDSDDGNEETVEYNVTASRSSELVQSQLEQFVVSEDRKRFECNTKCKTKRCPCVNDNKQKCTSLCHLNNKFCENK